MTPEPPDTTKSEQILAAIAELLDDVTHVGSRVYRSRQEAFARNEAPAIVVEPGIATAAPEPVSTCKIDWTQQVIIGVYTRGPIPDQLAAPIILDIHSKLLEDRSLGGLAMDIWPQSYDPQMAAADQPAGWSVLTFTVRYRTRVSDLSS